MRIHTALDTPTLSHFYQTSRIFTSSDMDDPVDDALGLLIQLRNLLLFVMRIFMSRR